MKTSQIKEEYGTVLIIAQRGQTSLSLPVTVQRVWLFLELKKSGLKSEKCITGDIICN